MILEERILQIPGEDGFWKKSSGEVFVKAAHSLVELGMNEDRAYDILRELYYATAACYE